VLATLAGCGAKPPPETLYLGQLLPLSGAERILGEHMRQGARLAAEEAARDNLRSGDRPLAVRLVDDRGDAEVVQAEASRLLSINRAPALLGGLDPRLNERLARTVGSSGPPLLLLGDPLPEPQGDAVFALGVPSATRGDVLARYAAEELKASRAAVLLDGRDPSAAALAATFVARWRRSADAKVHEASFSTDADAAGALASLENAKPQVVLLAVGPRLFGRLTAQTAPFKAEVLYAGPDQGAEPLSKDAVGPGIHLATVFSTEGLSTQGKTFAEQYQKEFRAPPDLAAAQAYDGVRLLFEALNKAGSTAAKLREYLADRNEWPSVTGPLSLKDHTTRRPVFVVRIANGSASLAKTYSREMIEKAEAK
jgi:branched-chain amino acid transport system substrate-binding protein